MNSFKWQEFIENSKQIWSIIVLNYDNRYESTNRFYESEEGAKLELIFLESNGWQAKIVNNYLYTNHLAWLWWGSSRHIDLPIERK